VQPIAPRLAAYGGASSFSPAPAPAPAYAYAMEDQGEEEEASVADVEDTAGRKLLQVTTEGGEGVGLPQRLPTGGPLRTRYRLPGLGGFASFSPAPAPAPAGTAYVGDTSSADAAETRRLSRKLAQAVSYASALPTGAARGPKRPVRGSAYSTNAAPAPAPSAAYLAEELAELPLASFAPAPAPGADVTRRTLLQADGQLRRPVLPALVRQAQSASMRARGPGAAPAPAPAAGADVVEAPAAS